MCRFTYKSDKLCDRGVDLGEIGLEIGGRGVDLGEVEIGGSGSRFRRTLIQCPGEEHSLPLQATNLPYASSGCYIQLRGDASSNFLSKFRPKLSKT